VFVPELSVGDTCEGCEDGDGVDRGRWGTGVEVSSVGVRGMLVVGVSVNSTRDSIIRSTSQYHNCQAH